MIMGSDEQFSGLILAHSHFLLAASKKACLPCKRGLCEGV